MQSRQSQMLAAKARQNRTRLACYICGVGGHGSSVCPSRETFPEYEYEQAQALNYYPPWSGNDPYSNSYNPGWSNYPDSSWRDSQQQPWQYHECQQQSWFEPLHQYQYQPNAQSYFDQPADQSSQQVQTSQDDMLEKLMQKMQQINQITDRIEAQLGQLVEALQNKVPEEFPNQLEQAEEITIPLNGMTVTDRVEDELSDSVNVAAGTGTQQVRVEVKTGLGVKMEVKPKEEPKPVSTKPPDDGTKYGDDGNCFKLKNLFSLLFQVHKEHVQSCRHELIAGHAESKVWDVF
ncbi:hypothetical protein ACOSP7_003989 [Xanthoceras sorbifolium]